MKKLVAYSVVFILLLPLMFMGPRDDANAVSYLCKCALPAMMVTMFWGNYLWILPQLERHGNKKRAALHNVLLILACSAVLAAVHTVEARKRAARHFGPPQVEMRAPEHRTPHMPPPPHPGVTHFVVFTGVRDALYLVLGAMVAYALLASRRMESILKRQQEAELARQEAELRSLRHQVSPHFLLNTLNNIYSLSVTGNERTSDAIMGLSQLLRHTLYDCREERVSLRSEADFIESYIQLMRLRLAPNIEVTTDLRIDDASSTQVVPLIFISLLENAFKHGTAPVEPCHIHIALYEDEAIHFVTRNSLHPKNHTDQSGHGIGLELVQKRLSIYYPAHHTWHYGPQGDEWVSDLTIFKV